jgi:ATP-dependent DNA helicase
MLTQTRGLGASSQRRSSACSQRPSCEFKLLDRIMTKLRARGHKTLIFSQMTRMLVGRCRLTL